MVLGARAPRRRPRSRPRGASRRPMSYARNGEVEIFHETFGDPADPALLLVNGLGSQCISYRVEWCEQFAAEGFYVIRFDNRDVGLSSKLTALYSLDDMAADAF